MAAAAVAGNVPFLPSPSFLKNENRCRSEKLPLPAPKKKQKQGDLINDTSHTAVEEKNVSSFEPICYLNSSAEGMISSAEKPFETSNFPPFMLGIFDPVLNSIFW